MSFLRFVHPSALDEEIQHLTLVVDRPPQSQYLPPQIEITISSRCR